jgi:hypothetical protein
VWLALDSLPRVEENRHLVVKKGGLDPLVRILDSPKKDHEAKRWVANVVGLLCMKDRMSPTPNISDHRNRLTIA